MRAESTRIIKEVRALMVPCFIVTAACALPLLRRKYGIGSMDDFPTLLAIVLGIPFLACSSFGNEFRNKTMELLMSQPVARTKVWSEKAIVTAAATNISVVFAFLSSCTPVHSSRDIGNFLIVFFVVMNCSATFWTLFARSMLGGLALSFGIVLLLFIGVSVNPFHVVPVYVFNAVLLTYSAVMLWLGWRKLSRFQMPGGFAGTDLMTVAPNIMPAGVTSLLRCRSNQVVLNLVRKELQLLRPLWVMAAFFVLGFPVVTAAATILPVSKGSKEILETLFVVVSTMYALVAMLLAGGASLSEEQESGLLAWHRTLPFSLRLHWAIKLIIGFISGLACAVALPGLMSLLMHAVFGPSFTAL